MVWQTGVKQITSPTGSEHIFVDNGNTPNTFLTPNQIVSLSTVKAQAYNTSALAAAGTLTAANVTGATDTLFLGMTGTFVAGVNIQMPTAAAIFAALNGMQGVGSTYVLRVINPSTQTLTITTNAGITISGSATLATLTFRDFLITITSATAISVQDVGAGAATAQ